MKKYLQGQQPVSDDIRLVLTRFAFFSDVDLDKCFTTGPVKVAFKCIQISHNRT